MLSLSGPRLSVRLGTHALVRSLSSFEISPVKPQIQYATVNPTTGQLVGEPFEFSTPMQVEQSLERAQAAFQNVPTDIGERAKMLNNASGILRENVSEYAELISLEMGKPITAARAEVTKCAELLSYYAANGAEQLRGYEVDLGGAKSYVRYEPIGTIFAVMPWNFPLWQVFRFAGPTLMAGNTAIVKHAPNVPRCAQAIEGVFRKAGFGDAVQNMFYDIDAAAQVIADDRIAGVTLTGSNRAGVAVAAAAGKALKKSVLELGGSDPFVVLEDADMTKTIDAAVASRMMNGGQSCISAKRFIVDKRVSGEFTERLCEAFAGLKVGDPFEQSTVVGPMARLDLRTQLHAQVEQSVEEGAEILLGGKAVDGDGFFYQPTVMRAGPNVAAFKEELFGPVAPIFEAEDETHAIKLANQTEFGLGGSVYTRDIERGERVASSLECGMAFVNAFVRSDSRLPFGGVKKSGYGRECASEGIREFVNIKTYYISQ